MDISALVSEAFSKVILPIGVALLTYLLVDRLGEFKKRRDYSRLGSAIIESLLEEVNTGIGVMDAARRAVQENSIRLLSQSGLPNKSWNGMTTIPDEVLLRILATSEDKKYEFFHPRECRIHCKNYFMHIKQNYEERLRGAVALAEKGQDWSTPLRPILTNPASNYHQSSIGVKLMLEEAKRLLDANARARFPK